MVLLFQGVRREWVDENQIAAIHTNSYTMVSVSH